MLSKNNSAVNSVGFLKVIITINIINPYELNKMKTNIDQSVKKSPKLWNWH